MVVVQKQISQYLNLCKPSRKLNNCLTEATRSECSGMVRTSGRIYILDHQRERTECGYTPHERSLKTLTNYLLFVNIKYKIINNLKQNKNKIIFKSEALAHSVTYINTRCRACLHSYIYIHTWMYKCTFTFVQHV